jgi:hypothetical protein
VRTACLQVNAGSEGSYQWAPKIGKSIQVNAKVEIVNSCPLKSQQGKYLWVEIKGKQ